MISPEEVKKLAHLARIEMTPEEETQFASEIDSILGYVAQVDTVSLQEERKLPQVRNVFRMDEKPHETEMYTHDIIMGAPKKEGNSFKVKKILSND
jgi:aspartyl-tRNA(Asn)/glutamyl-tRNA(Gln) amidotransferase subunit C